ncbi:MAG: HD-GYP domain-containing protein [Bacillota bacterium]|nr:HD-GYP domain-containing protein [Bacillota bacterium]
MLLLSIEETKPYMKLAKPIVDAEGNILLNKGCTLTSKAIKQLSRLGVFHIYVEDDRLGPIVIKDIIQEVTRRKCLKVTKEIMTNAKVGNVILPDKVTAIIQELLNELLTNPMILTSLTDVRLIKEYTLNHSVSVAVLAILMGYNLGLTKEELAILGIGALLHDIGKSKVSDAILDKPGKLTEEEFSQVKVHTEIGYQLLTDSKKFNQLVCNIAFQHHEKWNGSGYPRGLRGSEIHPFAQIVAIADVYDALTSDRIYRRRFLPCEALDLMASSGGQDFDPFLLQRFLESITLYPVGSVVMLNDGRIAVVIEQNRGCPARPVIRLIDSRITGTCSSNFPRFDIYDINLRENKHLTINNVLSM